MKIKLGYLGHFISGLILIVSAFAIFAKGSSNGFFFSVIGTGAYVKGALLILLGLYFLQFALFPNRQMPTWKEVAQIPLGLLAVEVISKFIG